MTFMSQHGKDAGPFYTSATSFGQHIFVRIAQTKDFKVPDTPKFTSNLYGWSCDHESMETRLEFKKPYDSILSWWTPIRFTQFNEN